MPTPPSVSPITNYLFDSAWTVVLLLGIAGAVALVAASRARHREAAIVGAVLLLLAVVAWFVERIVVTSGEHAVEATRDLVAKAEQADVAGTLGFFADDATLSLGDPRNPGLGAEFIRGLVDDLDGRYRVTENDISLLKGYSVSRDEAVVHLRCRTQLEFERGIPVPVRSGWVFRFVRDEAGAWRVRQITFVDYDGQTPTMDVFR